MSNQLYPQGRKWDKLPVKVSQPDFNKYIDPYLSKGRRGPPTKISRYKIFNYLLYVLHTGIQWNQLPILRKEISWSAIYLHHNHWSKDGSYEKLFSQSILFLNRAGKLELSIIHGDGSNTVAKKGGQVLATLDTNIRPA